MERIIDINLNLNTSNKDSIASKPMLGSSPIPALERALVWYIIKLRIFYLLVL